MFRGPPVGTHSVIIDVPESEDKDFIDFTGQAIITIRLFFDEFLDGQFRSAAVNEFWFFCGGPVNVSLGYAKRSVPLSHDSCSPDSIYPLAAMGANRYYLKTDSRGSTV